MEQRDIGTNVRRIATGALICVLVFATPIVYWVWGNYTLEWLLTIEPGQSAEVDFGAFWGAARLALEGKWLAPLDLDQLVIARNSQAGVELPYLYWLYAPAFLMFVAPLGLMSFPVSWALWGIVSVTAFMMALRPLMTSLGRARWFILFAPSVVVCVVLGQTTLLFCAVLVMGLEAMRAGNGARAGIAFGILTLKPQLGLALATALLAGRRWKTIGWASGVAILLAGVPTLVVGFEYWVAYVESMSASTAHILESHLVRVMVTPYSSMRMLGLDSIAPTVQLIVGIGLFAGLWMLWRPAAKVDFDLRAAGLCIATPLMTPYAFYYELGLALVGALYLWRAAGSGQSPAQFLAILLWAAPVLGATQLSQLGFATVCPILILSFIYVLVLARRKRGSESRETPLPHASQAVS